MDTQRSWTAKVRLTDPQPQYIPDFWQRYQHIHWRQLFSTKYLGKPDAHVYYNERSSPWGVNRNGPTDPSTSCCLLIQCRTLNYLSAPTLARATMMNCKPAPEKCFPLRAAWWCLFTAIKTLLIRKTIQFLICYKTGSKNELKGQMAQSCSRRGPGTSLRVAAAFFWLQGHQVNMWYMEIHAEKLTLIKMY